MNLLKQPPLAGHSGSERIRKVTFEDQREGWEEGVSCQRGDLCCVHLSLSTRLPRVSTLSDWESDGLSVVRVEFKFRVSQEVNAVLERSVSCSCSVSVHL